MKLNDKANSVKRRLTTQCARIKCFLFRIWSSKRDISSYHVIRRLRHHVNPTGACDTIAKTGTTTVLNVVKVNQLRSCSPKQTILTISKLFILWTGSGENTADKVDQFTRCTTFSIRVWRDTSICITSVAIRTLNFECMRLLIFNLISS